MKKRREAGSAGAGKTSAVDFSADDDFSRDKIAGEKGRFYGRE